MDTKYIITYWRGIVAFFLVVTLVGALPGGALAAPGDITRVSVDSNGVQGDGYSKGPAISADGRFVAFRSGASNLVVDDTNATEDVFVHDRQSGATTRVSVSSSGGQANGYSSNPAISSDGHFVVFASFANNLVEGDTNGFVDIFVHDTQTGETTRVSVDSNGAEANGDSDEFGVAISNDGRYVAFASEASNLVSGDTNGNRDVFVHDRQVGITTRVSVDSSGLQGDGGANQPVISGDGNFVAFFSNSTNLVSGDTNGVGDIFLHNLQTGQTTRVSVSTGGGQAEKSSTEPAISGDGRYVVFSSESEDLVPGWEIWEHVYVHDYQTGETTRVSVYSDGNITVGWSTFPTISADGRYVAFAFDDRSDGAPYSVIMLHDRQTGQSIEIGWDAAIRPSLSANGQLLAFESGSDNLVGDDTNGVSDIFVYETKFTPDPVPTVVSILQNCPRGCTSAADPIVDFTVTFSESVTGVTPDDFALTTTGDLSGVSVAEILGSGAEYIVAVNTGTGNGTLRLDVTDNDSIVDATGNPLSGTGAGNGDFNSGDVYTVNKGAPSVTSSLRADSSPTRADMVNFTVTFSETVSGVDVGDFSLTTTGNLPGASLMNVNGTGNLYTVTVSTGGGDGGLRLDLLDNDSIVNAANVPLGGAGAGNGNFTMGESYMIDKTAPVVTASTRGDSNPTAADVVSFTVVFSEAVSGVDGSDFLLSTTGTLSGAAITGVSGSGYMYTVIAVTGNGEGTLRLDIMDNDSVLDVVGNPLGGIGIGNGNFTTGEAYTVNKVPIVLLQESIRSTGANDGWVLESTEDSNVGGSKNSNAAVFALGDSGLNQQYRTILNFPTYYLSNNAVITRVLLMIRREGLVGDDPFTTHGSIQVDIRSGAFGFIGPFPYRGLQVSDFQSPSHMDAVGYIQNNPFNGWYWAWLNSSAFQYVNRYGTTQLRLEFQIDDNNDFGDDYLRFYSGDSDQLAFRPRLVVEYYVQK